MHGIFFSLIRNYIQKDPELDWQSTLKETGISPFKPYFNTKDYPDEEFFAIIKAIAKRKGKSENTVQEEIGNDFCIYFLEHYGPFCDSNWKTLDIAEKGAYFFEKILMQVNASNPLPLYRAERKSKDELHVFFQSPRKTCAILIGLLEKLSEIKGDKILIDHHVCMHSGEKECELILKNSSEHL